MSGFWINAIEASGLILAVLDFTGISRRFEEKIDRSRSASILWLRNRGYQALIEKPLEFLVGNPVGKFIGISIACVTYAIYIYYFVTTVEFEWWRRTGILFIDIIWISIGFIISFGAAIGAIMFVYIGIYFAVSYAIVGVLYVLTSFFHVINLPKGGTMGTIGLAIAVSAFVFTRLV